MNILVTGGAGYIGSHTCKALALNGLTPITYDNLSTGHDHAVKWGPFEKGDILDQSRLTQVIEKYNPTAVIHFAAHSQVGESVENPIKYYRNNVSGSLSLLEVMKNTGIKHIVFSSTAAVYGIPDITPIPEDHVLKPINPYGMSKLMIELMLKDFDNAYGIKYIALRYFNAAGADPDGQIGEEHEPESHLIPLVLQAASGKRDNIKIFGNDYDTPDGTCIRDYIHVADLASAHVMSLNYLKGSNSSDSFNLGTGKGYSVNEIIEQAREITNKEIMTTITERRNGDPAVLVAASSKVKESIGWQPVNSNLDMIIKTAWKFIQ